MNRLLPLFLVLVSLISSAAPTQRNDSATEALGWKLALKGYTLQMFPVLEQLDIIKDLGVKYYELNLGQELRAGDKAKKIVGVGPDMSAEDLAAFKAKLAECKIRVVSCGIVHNPEEFVSKDPSPEKREAGLRRLLTFLKDLGAENLGIESKPTPLLVKLSVEIGLKIAIHNHPKTYPPEQVLEETKDLPDTFGACADVGHYTRRGLYAPDAIKLLGKRVIQLHLKDVDMKNPAITDNAKKRDTAFGQGQTDIKGVLGALKAIGFKGVMAIEYDTKPKDPVEARATFLPQLARDVAYVDQWAEH